MKQHLLIGTKIIEIEISINN